MCSAGGERHYEGTENGPGVLRDTTFIMRVLGGLILHMIIYIDMLYMASGKDTASPVRGILLHMKNSHTLISYYYYWCQEVMAIPCNGDTGHISAANRYWGVQ